MKRIYITHCSAKKNESFRDSGELVLPEELYTSINIQRFIEKCKKENVEWAIFSDKFGVIFPRDRIPWYDKHPNKVSEIEFKKLLQNLVSKLFIFNEIWFYHNPGRFHSFYKKLIDNAKLEKLNIHLFSKKNEIINTDNT